MFNLCTMNYVEITFIYAASNVFSSLYLLLCLGIYRLSVYQVCTINYLLVSTMISISIFNYLYKYLNDAQTYT